MKAQVSARGRPIAEQRPSRFLVDPTYPDVLRGHSLLDEMSTRRPGDAPGWITTVSVPPDAVVVADVDAVPSGCRSGRT
jgi:hypothetical protein